LQQGDCMLVKWNKMAGSINRMPNYAVVPAHNAPWPNYKHKIKFKMQKIALKQNGSSKQLSNASIPTPRLLPCQCTFGSSEIGIAVDLAESEFWHFVTFASFLYHHSWVFCPVFSTFAILSTLIRPRVYGHWAKTRCGHICCNCYMKLHCDTSFFLLGLVQKNARLQLNFRWNSQ